VAARALIGSGGMLAGLGRFLPPGARHWLRRSLSPAPAATPSPRRRPRAAGDRRVHVHIGVNFFGAGNLGDDLMLAGFLAALGPRVERLALTCCTPFDRASQQRRFPAITWLADDAPTRAQALADADVWLALGDTPFQLLSGPWMRDYLAAQIDAVARHALPMFYLGIGTEGDDVLADPLFRTLAAGAERIWCRDAASARRLAPHALSAVQTGADLCHAYFGRAGASASPRDGEINDADLGLVVAFESPDRFDAGAVRRAIDGWRAPVWLVQEVREFAGGERHGLSRLDRQTRRRLRVAAPDYAGAADVDALLAAWPHCATVASSRYHALCINAWRGSRLVAVQRSGKIGGIAEDFALPHAELARLAEALPQARAVSQPRLEALAASAVAMVDDFCRAVGVEAVTSTGVRGPTAPRIAVVKLDGLGDFVLATPFLRALRTIWPDSSVTVMVLPAAAALAQLCPYVSRVVVIDAVNAPTPIDAAFDLVFVPRPASDYFGGVRLAAQLPAAARWGFAGTAANQAGLTHLVPIPAADSHARLNLRLLWAFTRRVLDDRLEVWPSAAALERWQTRFAAERAGQARPLCLIGVGAGHAWKCWPAARWAVVAAHVRDVHGLVPVIVGSPDESPLAEAVLRREPHGVVNAIGASMDDLCALATLARLFVGNDSGPKHVAAASGARVVELNAIIPDDATVAESQPVYFRPHGVPHELLQPASGFTRAAMLQGATIRSIAPARVLTAVDRVLAVPDVATAAVPD
jgi:ADP-heptose:LPS heptosyltransferase